MQSTMFTLFKKDVEEVFKCFYNYVPSYENIFDINVNKFVNSLLQKVRIHGDPLQKNKRHFCLLFD
mgnify:CR=1 FL=1